jgi:uncharacterized protein YcaQ
MAEIFEFDYNLEMYKPAAKRRWGYWAMLTDLAQLLDVELLLVRP